jgi:hypothetical protein
MMPVSVQHQLLRKHPAVQGLKSDHVKPIGQAAALEAHLFSIVLDSFALQDSALDIHQFDIP